MGVEGGGEEEGLLFIKAGSFFWWRGGGGRVFFVFVCLFFKAETQRGVQFVLQPGLFRQLKAVAYIFW